MALITEHCSFDFVHSKQGEHRNFFPHQSSPISAKFQLKTIRSQINTKWHPKMFCYLKPPASSTQKTYGVISKCIIFCLCFRYYHPSCVNRDPLFLQQFVIICKIQKPGSSDCIQVQCINFNILTVSKFSLSSYKADIYDLAKR